MGYTPLTSIIRIFGVPTKNLKWCCFKVDMAVVLAERQKAQAEEDEVKVPDNVADVIRYAAHYIREL